MQYARLLGYRKGADGNAEIVSEEAEIVKEIFSQYLDGSSMEQIADRLSKKGLTTKGSGSPYRKIVIQRILTNEKYTGDALLQKTYITDCVTKKSRKNNGELPMYLVKNHHEPTSIGCRKKWLGGRRSELSQISSPKANRASTAQNMRCRNC